MTATTPTGELRRVGDGLDLVFVRTHRFPVVEVWRALTEPDRTEGWIGRWTGDPASGTVRLTMSAEADDAAAEPVTIDACDAPRRLVVSTTAPGGPWHLEVTLDEDGEGGTRLTFTHRLATDDDAASIGPGWHFYLDRLDAVVRGETPPDRWDDYYPALAGAYERPAPS